MRELWQSPSIQNNVSGGSVSVSTRVAVVEQTSATQIYRINGPAIGKHLLGQLVSEDSIKLSSILSSQPESYSRQTILSSLVIANQDGENETPLEADNNPPPDNNTNDDHSTSNQQGNDDRSNNAADDSDINNNNDNADDNNSSNNNDNGSNNQNNDPDDNDQQNSNDTGDLNEDDRTQEGDENSDSGNPDENDKLFGDQSDKFVSINTPYDSIEAQFKPTANSSFKKDSPTSPEGGKSDEFSGTESMEYIHIPEQQSPPGKENWYTSLITIEDSKPCDNSFDDSNKPGEVHVITGNDTLSAVICLEEGLADDDSWVEELDRDEFAESSEEEEEEEEDEEEEEYEEDIPYATKEEPRYTRTEIDFTLHTIIEESCEESDDTETEKTATELEKYFFEFAGENASQSKDLDSVSETSSIFSEAPDKQDTQDEKDPAELASSRLEKYFLSGFMGFNKRDSDGSVGSDSEGKHSPEQRRKKLVRARGSRQHASSDNLNNETELQESKSQSEDSDDDVDENNSFDKNDGQFDTVKRTKKKKRSMLMSSVEHLETCEQHVELTVETSEAKIDSKSKPDHVTPFTDLNIAKENVTEKVSLKNSLQNEIKNFLNAPNPPTEGLSRKDSFNNWSSDEETNLMMSKMRTFFKNMIANQRKTASPVVKNRNKPPQLIYFESELTRLMKTVPGLRDDQVKEIVEYLSSEDTWSDSYDSSDYTSSDLEVGTKKNPFQGNLNVANINNVNNSTGFQKDSDLMYHCLMSSFQRIEPSQDSSSTQSRNSPPLINKVMQHIGTRLVALMHEVSEGATTPKGRYHRRMQPKLPTISTTTEEEDSVEECSPLPRSKSYDPLLEESRQETSDNERFSWRGSFESALMTGSDSRTRLPSTGENSSSALVVAAAKRRSAGDLLFKSGNNSREHLDRVRSCGSIGGSAEDKIWSMRHPRKRRSSVPDAASNSGESADGENDSDDEDESERDKALELGKSTTLPRTLQTCTSMASTTNSLPRLSSTSPVSPSIYKVNSVHQFNVKSARYRPPGYNSRNSGSMTICAPPRREYGRRRPSPHQLSPSILASMGTGDDCSVSSDISERTGILDDECEKSPLHHHHHRVSTISVTRSDSMASVYSGAGEGRYGVVPVRGEVEFSLQYNYKAGDVEIHVKRCSDLAAVDVKRNRSDPYVKVYLLPDKSKSGKRKTRVKKHTLNPVFDETLKYHLPIEELETRTLWLSVWHSDIFGRNDFLGEVIIPLENKVFDDPLPKLYALQERSEVIDNLSNLKGELIVALKFVSNIEGTLKKRPTKEAGSLHVLIKEAKGLSVAKSSGASDPFCKSYLLPSKGRSCKQKTPVLKRTCHPIWNHTFVYNNVTLDELSQRCLELTIWDHDRLASNEFLGGVRLSLGTGLYNDKSVDWMDSNNREIALWQRMIDHSNFWVESSLVLRPSLDVRNKT
ncbi:probable serine/threonine-protein kinase DDB_G0282963 [Planococcus citri]|uniref:probable serine/threonine-protein kinase DDB_G0282963 n=1 Tax=Planococcus citri TaxID=170843 RepID=UPI0031F96A57